MQNVETVAVSTCFFKSGGIMSAVRISAAYRVGLGSGTSCEAGESVGVSCVVLRTLSMALASFPQDVQKPG